MAASILDWVFTEAQFMTKSMDVDKRQNKRQTFFDRGAGVWGGDGERDEEGRAAGLVWLSPTLK